MKSLSTQDIMHNIAVQITFNSRERRKYIRKTEFASLYPSSYLSLVVDGADQTKFTLPNLCSPVKNQRENGIAVDLFFVLRHGPVNRLRLLTMTNEKATGANHVIKFIQSVINDV